jgi:hypothetical protein
VPLIRAIVGCHLALMAALTASLVPPPTAVRLGVAALLALPSRSWRARATHLL